MCNKQAVLRATRSHNTAIFINNHQQTISISKNIVSRGSRAVSLISKNWPQARSRNLGLHPPIRPVMVNSMWLIRHMPSIISMKVGMEGQVRDMSDKAPGSNSQQMSHSLSPDTAANRGRQGTVKGVITPRTTQQARPRISKSTQWILVAVHPHLTQIVEWMTLRITPMIKSRSTNKKWPMWWRSTQMIIHLPLIWLTRKGTVRGHR